MSDPYIGEIRLVGFTFAPPGWVTCNGQLLSIADYETLFVLIGTTFGGDGQTTFAVPDLRGRLPVGMGTSPGGSQRVLGQPLGAESRTLTTNQLPTHTHGASSALRVAATLPVSDGRPTTSRPHGAVPTAGGSYAASGTTTNGVDTSPSGTTGATGGGLPIDVTQPTLVVNFIICTDGIFPSPQ